MAAMDGLSYRVSQLDAFLSHTCGVPWDSVLAMRCHSDSPMAASILGEDHVFE